MPRAPQWSHNDSQRPFRRRGVSGDDAFGHAVRLHCHMFSTFDASTVGYAC
jgi:hypothetical protein